MGSIGWYIFRTTFGAFLLVVGSLTPVIWMILVLRNFDLVTTQGQSVFVFLGISSLAIPGLLLPIGPIALVIAVAHVLNKLGTDSEIIVMNASGMSPWRLFRAFLAVGVVVSVIVAVISTYIAPKSLRMLRDFMTEARANLVANVLQPGSFKTLELGLTFHIRERQANGVMRGIVVDDRRSPQEHVTIVAEQGEILENEHGTYLVLENGNVQRHEVGQRDPNIVVFKDYAFDLSRYAGSHQTIKYSVREQYLWQLAFPDLNDPDVRNSIPQYRAEFHDRIMAPLYPIGFLIIVYTYLGAPQTNRQSRALSLLTAIAGVSVMRLAGFASNVFGLYAPAALSLQYIALLAISLPGLAAISRGVIIEPPTFAIRGAALLAQLFARRAVAT
jgi:lipopolysaccharide export system permease protein